MQITYKALAKVDLNDGYERFERKASGLGRRFVLHCVHSIDELARFPRFGGRVKRGVQGREVRILILKDFQYLVHYEVTTKEVYILSVTDARRRGHPWRQRL